ncbi:MAG: hypothetical protein QM537_01470 [Candidatus Symbiobacter sp.]|nr:hypothetical protein [Candidatus Symbiobacter sp.]
MTIFNHTPDNYIVMRQADADYHAELNTFQSDLLVLSLPPYGGLASPWRRRLYSDEQELHCVFDGTVQAASANVGYPDADLATYCANFSLLVERSAARKLAENPPLPAPSTPTPPTPTPPA